MRHTFEIPGPPIPKGSMKSFVSNTTGRVVTVHDNAKLAGYVKRIQYAAQGCPLFGGAVAVSVSFALARPGSHFTGRGAIKMTAPLMMTRKPDVDKLTRAVLDALTGIAYHDDAQVVSITATKSYDLMPSTTITISGDTTK